MATMPMDAAAISATKIGTPRQSRTTGRPIRTRAAISLHLAVGVFDVAPVPVTWIAMRNSAITTIRRSEIGTTLCGIHIGTCSASLT